jgi:hypothetical protein
LKFISWSISLGSGTSGGTLAPLFTIGGAFGALTAMALLHYFPHAPINLPLAALIGMASMFAGASRALLTSIVFALETTGQASALLPLLGACTSAYFVSFFLMEGSIMTEKIKRRGINAPTSYHPDILQSVPVAGFLTKTDNNLLHLPHILKTDDLSFAAEMMGRYSTNKLLVVENKDNMTVSGMITSEAILNYYSNQKQKDLTYESPGKTKRILVQGRRIFLKKNPNRERD